MASLYEDRDPCGGDDWKVVDVAKMSFSGSRENEPLWQAESLITGLRFYTQYAIYVKTVVIPDRDSPNHNMAAQSRIHYFTTLPGGKNTWAMRNCSAFDLEWNWNEEINFISSSITSTEIVFGFQLESRDRHLLVSARNSEWTHWEISNLFEAGNERCRISRPKRLLQRT